MSARTPGFGADRSHITPLDALERILSNRDYVAEGHPALVEFANAVVVDRIRELLVQVNDQARAVAAQHDPAFAALMLPGAAEREAA